jgi:formylglycine-generating enzyme required for sulfatase activity
MKKFFYCLVLLTGFAFYAAANNVVISNVSIINNGAGNIQVKFDLSWENSWRVNVGPNNYDGVWVFFKYKNAADNWVHMTMTGSNNVIPVGVDVYQTNDFLKTGAVIYREANGIGNMNVVNIRLGVLSTLPYDVDIKGFAVEMVYIPAPPIRPFFGDGDGVTESLNALHYTDNTATTSSVIPMKVDLNGFDDEELEGVTNSTGIYIYSNDTIQLTVPLGTLDPFPTMKALWCMKYEINQAGYRDFLNTLSYTQQAARTSITPNSVIGTGALTTAGLSRNFIEIKTPGVAFTTPAVYGCDASSNNVYDENGDGEWIACGFITWPDAAAWLDWSGLAPMSELQFEKICRGASSAGPNPAVLGEYAWGSADIFGSVYTLTGSATPSELASNASPSLGNAPYSLTSAGGPLRSGVFATATSNRQVSGASFYGVMELSGNLSEYCITLGNVAGRSCEYVPNGNGNINASGNAQLSVGGAGFWPGMEGNTNATAANTCAGTCEVTGSAGMMMRGGGFDDPATELSIAERGAFTPTARVGSRGGRGVLYIR